MVSKSSGMIPILMAGLTQTATALVNAVDIPSIERGQMAQVLASVPVCDEMNIGIALQPLIMSIFASHYKFASIHASHENRVRGVA